MLLSIMFDGGDKAVRATAHQDSNKKRSKIMSFTLPWSTAFRIHDTLWRAAQNRR